jgi:hypothetical protein
MFSVIFLLSPELILVVRSANKRSTFLDGNVLMEPFCLLYHHDSISVVVFVLLKSIVWVATVHFLFIPVIYFSAFIVFIDMEPFCLLYHHDSISLVVFVLLKSIVWVATVHFLFIPVIYFSAFIVFIDIYKILFADVLYCLPCRNCPSD